VSGLIQRRGLLLQVGDDGSVLPATEDEVFQSLVSGSGNGLSSFDPDGSDGGEDEEEDDEEGEEDDEGTEYDTDEEEQDERDRRSKTLRPRSEKSLQGLQFSIALCIYNESMFKSKVSIIGSSS
jgi:hypothetical protein